jgi:dipeptidyl-peptidase 4
MAPPALLTRLVLLITLLLGVLAAEHVAPDSKTTKRQSGPYPDVFISNNNVFVATSSSSLGPMSTNGTPENPYEQNSIRISPNNTHAVVWQYTPEAPRYINYVVSSPTNQLYPKTDKYYQVKPGDKVRVDRPRLFNLATRSEIPTSDALFKNPYALEDVGWSPDGTEYRFKFNERGHARFRLIGISLNGTVRAIVDESTTSFFDYAHKHYCVIIDATKEVVWMSERDGWNHLYLYDLLTGTVKNQITTGNWLVRGIERIDPDTRRIWFKAFGIVAGQDPYYAHLVRVKFDGDGLKILTSGGGNDGDGTHTWEINWGTGTFVDRFSRIDMPETVLTRGLENGEVITVTTNPSPPAPSSLVAERFAAPGRDGTTPIHGIIVKPTNFDPTKRYPVVEHVYAGPHDFSTPKAWNDLRDFPTWAGSEFIVVKLDGMGTNWRHKAFHNVAHKNLSDAGFPDRRAWITAAAATRPWMDVRRVGVIGGSAGGQNAMGALLWHGDFYKAAMSDCGCHDNRMDKMWWNELWMGADITQPHWAASSNVVNAHRLQGKLLLIVGELDQNVDPSSTYQAANALNNAGKEYDFLLVPNGGHTVGFDTAYGRTRTRTFLFRHLGGVF